MSCVGYTVEAHTDRRSLSDSERIALELACTDLCAGCKGVRGKGSKPLELKRWTAMYRCKRPGDTGEFCGFACSLLITEFREKEQP
jgi:hypothetical protein